VTHSVETALQVDAKKTTLRAKEALALVREVDEIYVTKRRQVIHLDLRKERPDNAELLGLLLGPTGNLRAPTLRKGRTLAVGFDAVTYAKLFG
jgi:arsenate reductase-like glutaredoxin family protein